MVAPSLAGAVQLTVMLPLLSAVALTAVGAPGGSAGMTFWTRAAGLTPEAFQACR
jgi:hypothetical protein